MQKIGARYYPLIIVAFALPLFFYKLGALALVGPDEPRYAQVAREMFLRGDLVTPTLLGDTWFEKPALLYWLMIGCYHLLGVNEWAARLPNALLATINLLLIYTVAKRAGGAHYALLSAMILASCGLYFGLARAASFDMTLTFTLTAAFVCFHRADTAQERGTRRKYLYGFYAALGLSVLAKGLAGIVVAGVSLALYFAITILLTRDWRRLLPLFPFTGLLVFLAVAALWYAPVIARHGWLFIDEFFIQHHFQRYTTNKYHHPGPVYFFVQIILAGVVPWSVVLLSAVVRAIKERRARIASVWDERAKLMLLAACWVIAPLLFFSFSTSKLPGYILPVFPCLALIIAAEVEALLAGRASLRVYAITALILLVTGAALPFFAHKEFNAGRGAQLFLALGPVLSALAVLIACWRRQALQATYALLSMSPILAVAIATTIFTGIENKSSLAPLSRAAAEQMRPGERVVLYNLVQYSPFFYTNGRVVEGERGEAARIDNVDELARWLSDYESLLCIVRARQLEQITGDARFQSTTISQQRDRVLVRVRMNHGDTE